MLFSKALNRKIINLLGISILVTALIVIPSLLKFNFFDLPFSGSVQAQVPVPEVSSEVKIDAFKMTMGALFRFSAVYLRCDAAS